MKGLSGGKLRGFKWRTAYYGLVFLAVGNLISCFPSKFSLPPLPARIESIEGYGSLRISSSEASSRVKFSFLFVFSHQGRIESFDLIGRSLYYILIGKDKSFFVIPSKKVYWQGDVEEIIYRALGFRLNQHEMIGILSGEWDGEYLGIEAEKSLQRWRLKKDDQGRIIWGEREELRFEILEFFSDSRIARLVHFYHPWSEGKLKILQIYFNQPVNAAAFSTVFVKRYERKTWAEIENLINNED